MMKIQGKGDWITESELETTFKASSLISIESLISAICSKLKAVIFNIFI